MNEGKGHDQGPPKEMQPGFCSATCTDKKSMMKEIEKPQLKTSDLFITCNLPKRFEYPHWFNGYGCQVSKQHPFYRTSSSEYGWYPPVFCTERCKQNNIIRLSYFYLSVIAYILLCWHTVPRVYFPKKQEFTNQLAKAGMYRNYSLNTGFDQ